MNRHEFLKQLEHALEAEMNPAKVREHVDYYRSYIAEEVKKWKVREGSDGSSRGSVGDRKVYH